MLQINFKLNINIFAITIIIIILLLLIIKSYLIDKITNIIKNNEHLLQHIIQYIYSETVTENCGLIGCQH